MNYAEQENQKRKRIIRYIVYLLITLSIIFGLIVPLAKPWWSEQTGKAELKQAEQNRQIAVQEAQARLESSKLDAQAEIERAKGVAEANEIIGSSLKGNSEYLTYLWINALYEDSNSIVYVPTEANLPVLEANRQYPNQ